MADPREPLGRLVHGTRLTDEAEKAAREGRERFRLGTWEERHPDQRELDMRIGYAVANFALTENAATWDLACHRCAGFADRANQDRERAERAEAKLAVIAERCKQPDQLLGTQVLVDRDAILAIIGSEEGDSRDG